MNLKLVITISIFFATFFSSCKKKTTTPEVDVDVLKSEILTDISNNICQVSYQEMNDKALLLDLACQTLQTNPTQANLIDAQTKWKSLRATWEQTESWLFGPISANNIDPRIDTWPVDFNALENIIQSTDILSESYVSNLDDALKGFHPIEYVLWDSNGNRQANQLSVRQLEYLVALSHNLTTLCKEVNDTWKNGFTNQLATAGKGSTTYSKRVDAYLEVTDAMIGICDEVANGKIEEPFLAQNPLLEESPFAKNSRTDFTNNIQGVIAIYTGKFNSDKKGLEDLVRNHNLSLDQKIKNTHAEAIASLNVITIPFGEAIISNPILIQNTIEKINNLAMVLEIELRPFILQYGN